LRFVSMSQQQQQQQQQQPSSVTPANPPSAYTSVYNGGPPVTNGDASRPASPAPRHHGHSSSYAQPSNANMSAALRANFREEQHDAPPPFMMHAGGSRRTSPNRGATTPRSSSAVNRGEALPLSAYRRR
jgi:hypothetical protein